MHTVALTVPYNIFLSMANWEPIKYPEVVRIPLYIHHFIKHNRKVTHDLFHSKLLQQKQQLNK